MNDLDPSFTIGLMQTVQLYVNYGQPIPNLIKNSKLMITLHSIPERPQFKYYLTFTIVDVIVSRQRHTQYILRLDYATRNEEVACISPSALLDFPYLIDAATYSYTKSKQLPQPDHYDIHKETYTKVYYHLLFLPSSWWLA
jgi:hypothetical protein